MAIFFDTGVFIGCCVERDAHRDAAGALFLRGCQGEWGAMWTSDLVFAEVLNFFTCKRVLPQAVSRFLAATRGSDAARAPVQPVLRASGPTFTRALETYEQNIQRRLSFTDCATLVLLESRKIATLATFDGPLAAEARRRGIDVIGLPESP